MKRISGDTVIAFVVLLFSISFLYFGRSFPQRSKIIPYGVSWLVLFLAVAQIFIESIPGLKKLETGKVTFFSGSSGMKQINRNKKEEESESQTNILRFWNILKWILLLTAGIYLFGFLLSFPFFICLFYRLEAGYPWVKSFLVAFIFLVTVFLFFQLFLNVELFKGILF